ncbi:asparagine synthase (glutamine-hydrolyzing) (plasmid) [Deinococcus radiomollis]|uniref:asparagine synthase (glutamine-hydrolyzing) n=1 Tax=Deinococcus radiomollis TaxID=468916 RepID=UPI00389214CE
MCGIVGAINVLLSQPEHALQQSLTTMIHRGPDGQGIYQRENVWMGMRRLAIIDLVHGEQPIYNEDHTLAVVFNGEIYNYRELMAELKLRGHHFATESDTEVLVHLYEERGPAMLNELRGMFVFAIHDLRDGSVFIARDRFGKKPLYYTSPASGGLLFASEIKALRPLADASRERWRINDQAIYDYLSLGVVPQPSTVYLGVYALLGGHWLRYKDEQLHIERYWQPEFAPKTSLSYEEAQERTRQLMGEATRLRLRSDVPLGVFLSGGVDSSVVAYEAAQQLGESLQTFTVATEGDHDESPVAVRTARALGIRNHILRINPSPLEGLQTLVRQYDQPYSDSSAIPSLEISRLARQHVTVVLNGDGGDEIFAGYRRYLAVQRSAMFGIVPQPLARTTARLLEPLAKQRRSPLGFAARFARGLTLSSGERYLAWTCDMMNEADKRSAWQGPPMLPTEERVANLLRDDLPGLDRQLDGDVKINLQSDLLVKMDMATMAASVEGRSPFLDHQVADFAWTLPDHYRLRKGIAKAVLRDAYRGKLTDEVVTAPKRGFEIPLESWLKNELKEVLMDTLSQPNALIRSYIDAAMIDGVLAQKMLTDRNWAYIVYSWLVLELWLQEEQTRA